MDLDAWGWDESWAEKAAVFEDPSALPGRVTTRERNGWTVRTADGSHAATIPGSWSFSLVPSVGDWVLLRPAASDPLIIERVLPRRSKFSRRAAGPQSHEQVVAANVDVVWIVHGLDLEPNTRRLERYLALAWESGANPVFVLTKGDIALDLPEAISAVEGVAFGVPVHVTSVNDEASIKSLGDTVPKAATVALLGPSGVGKSSLINSLAGGDLQATGDVRAFDRKGRHTTTRRQLFSTKAGALFLDTPGMRELQIWELDEGLEQAFPEIEELASQCRFRDCAHDTEPGCRVLAAVDSGAVPLERLNSYRKLKAEAAYVLRKTDPTARAEAVREFKTAMKTLKHHAKYQERKK